MPRSEISYEEVARAAAMLVERGFTPSIQRIQGELGAGSPNLIHGHLRAWKIAQQPAEREPVHLPEALLRAFVDEIERQVSKVRLEAEAHVEEALEAADTLAENGHELEVKTEQFRSLATRLEGECDKVSLERNEAVMEVERLRKALNDERNQAKKTQESLVQAQERISLLVEERDKYRQESMENQRALQVTRRLQLAAERARAVAETKQAAAEHNVIEQREALKAERQARRLDADTVRKDIALTHSEWKERLAVLEQKVQKAEQRTVAAERERSKLDIQLKALKSQDGVRSPGKRRMERNE
ncbi:DNA-binding protein [Halomonas sp. LS-001]